MDAAPLLPAGRLPATVLLGRLTILLALLAPALALAFGTSAFTRPSAHPPGRGAAASLTAGAFNTPGPSAPLDAQALALRSANEAVPVIASGLSPVRPFILSAPLGDTERAVDCLAAAQWYEAGRGGEDQRSVAQVVLNRVRHAAYPHTVCGVVFQGSQLATGCQFTFTCDGSLRLRTPSPQAWQEARQTARAMLFGRTEAAVGQATHYHTDWVAPAWSRQMDKIAAVRTHLFFRWRGSSGEASALSRPHAGAEPHISLLARLSPFHAEPIAGALKAQSPVAGHAASALVPAPSPAPTPAPGPSLATREALPDRIAAPGAGVHLIALPVGTPPESFVHLAEQACAGQPSCRFIGWTDATRPGRGLPLSGSSVDAISFSYVRREGTAPARVQWNCGEFPRTVVEECLRRGG